ncbi:uncharacterized protein LOC118183644 [Stegodyphus dumicola]|uniref:uncharacterized protein LOC118183644 n=1 Tax=Stegodyphus dumicola TaxID=202533 RepID=UPI0015AC0224|nr:uncharacterized protein LOC118183644 [Stegodyphus dumicola]
MNVNVIDHILGTRIAIDDNLDFVLERLQECEGNDEDFIPNGKLKREVSQLYKKSSPGLDGIHTVIIRSSYELYPEFRKYNYALGADVQKMYRQILIEPSQRNLQLILWKESVGSPVQTYRLRTVTYGTASAPFLATRVLKQLAMDEATDFPHASRAILKDCYVDDIIHWS